ncbi:Kinesin-3 [Platanthera guangdongensis]|uniref:Kinesin-3 n=1 Tax=Platanthera guangdongensis TaxID=2320717 RepID=A0ABR2MRI0_9ASPA
MHSRNPNRNSRSPPKKGDVSDAVPCSESSKGESTSGQLEFKSREDAQKLLAEKSKPRKRIDIKGKNEDMREYIKKLKTCILWYLEVEDRYIAEQEKLGDMLKSEEIRHSDIEASMSGKIDVLNTLNEELQRHKLSLEETLRKEKADKMSAIASYEREAEEKIASEKLRYDLLEELERSTQEKKHLNDQIKMIHDTNKRLQEYNTSLQQYNSNLQDDVLKNGETIKKLQKDKTAMMETLTGVRDQSSLLKNQIDTIRISQQEAVKQRDEFKKEVSYLRSELQQVRVDRDHQLELVQSMIVELKKCEEINRKSSRDMDNALMKAAALEEKCSSQQDQLKNLNHQVAVANEKLKERREIDFE